MMVIVMDNNSARTHMQLHTLPSRACTRVCESVSRTSSQFTAWCDAKTEHATRAATTSESFDLIRGNGLLAATALEWLHRWQLRHNNQQTLANTFLVTSSSLYVANQHALPPDYFHASSAVICCLCNTVVAVASRPTPVQAQPAWQAKFTFSRCNCTAPWV
jgi:hypothetical protein